MVTAKKCNTAAGAATMGLKIETVPETACVKCRFFDPTKIVKKGDLSTGCKKPAQTGRYIWTESDCPEFKACGDKHHITAVSVSKNACVTCKHFDPTKISEAGDYIQECKKRRSGKYIWSDSCCEGYAPLVEPKVVTISKPTDVCVSPTACVRCKHFDPSKMRDGSMSSIDGCKAKPSARQHIWTDSCCVQFESHHKSPSACATIPGLKIELLPENCGDIDVIKKCVGCPKLKLFGYSANVESSHMPGYIYTQIFVCAENGDAPLRKSFQDKCEHCCPRPSWMQRDESGWRPGGAKPIKTDGPAKNKLVGFGCVKDDTPCKHIIIGNFTESTVGVDSLRVRCALAKPSEKAECSLNKQNCKGKYYEPAK